MREIIIDGITYVPDVEVKSKRVQLLLQPSIYDRAKSKAIQQGLSLNEYIHRLIDTDTRRRKKQKTWNIK